VTYSGDPTASQRDEVRFLLGDTDGNPDFEMLSDGEVDYLLLTWNQPMRAAHAGALALEAKFTKLNQSIGSVNVDYLSLAAQYRELAASLARRGGFTTIATGSIPLVGGMAGTPRSDGTPIVLDTGIDWHNYQNP
jgi:hypothetical protein